MGCLNNIIIRLFCKKHMIFLSNNRFFVKKIEIFIHK